MILDVVVAIVWERELGGERKLSDNININLVVGRVVTIQHYNYDLKKTYSTVQQP